MLSEANARLVEGRAELGDPELVRIKGAGDPAPARRLLGVAPGGRTGRHEAAMIGREREMDWLTRMFNQTLRGAGRAVCVVGPPGIGKSRLIGEIATIAVTRGTKVFSTFCQSHTGNIPFYAVSGLLRAVFEVDELDAASARERVRARLPGADADDLVLLDDLLGIRDGADELPVADPEARRRRLARLGRFRRRVAQQARGVRGRGCALGRRCQRIHVRRVDVRARRDVCACADHLPPGVPRCAQPRRGIRGDCACPA